MAQVRVAAPGGTSRYARERPARTPAPARAGWTALLVSTGARAVLVLLAGLLLWSVAPVIGGWSSSVVMSNSMAPRLLAGDVVLVRPVQPEELRVGQVLLVDDPDRPDRMRLHRLTGIDAGTGALTLKGDANARADSTHVHPDAVHGVAALRVPWIGSPKVWLAEGRTAPVSWTAAALTAAIMGAWCYRPAPATGTTAPRHRAPAAARSSRGPSMPTSADDGPPPPAWAAAGRTDTCPLPWLSDWPDHRSESDVPLDADEHPARTGYRAWP